MGALVPLVKSEPAPSDSTLQPLPQPEAAEAAAEMTENGAAELDRDFLCPICMQMMKDAFLTACGHSFCYMCIATHLQNKSDCPCCGHFLTTNHLFPNFLLDKLLKKTSARQIAKTATPFEQLRLALQQGCEVSVKELDSLLSLLLEKKRKTEQEEAETNMQILHEFLYCLRKQKLEMLNEIQTDIKHLKEDINAVERHRIDLYRVRERYSAKPRMLADDPAAIKARSLLIDRRSSGVLSGVPSVHGRCWTGSGNVDVKAPLSSQINQKRDTGGGSASHVTQSGEIVARKRRVHAQFVDLQDCYLQKRRHKTRELQKHEERDPREGYHAGLEDFQSVLSSFTRYSRLSVVAEIRHGDFFHSANIVSSIEFDRDDELFATAGVSRRIKVFEYSSIINEPTEVQCPVTEMSTRSKLSCLSWNKYTKNHIASSDYDGIVTVWDVTIQQSVMEYEEHEKRAWSVDFSRAEPSMLVSGSDDCKVKIWCMNQEASVLNIDMKANICSVKYNPGSSIYVAVGSADHHIHYYDLRNVSQPLHIFRGHGKAVSYVKFMSNNELASASTDSTLRLWDVNEKLPIRIFRGHTNEKNFVGLSVNKEYIACGSETNEVFAYHKAISKPAACHKFGSSDLDEADNDDDDPVSYFISAVCWKNDGSTLLSANSRGTIKVLALAT